MGCVSASKRYSVPGGAPEETASMRRTICAFLHVSIKSAPSPVHSLKSVPGRPFALSARIAASPASSSLRYSLPIPIRRMCDGMSYLSSLALDMQFEKVCGTGDARIIVANRLLALPGELLLRSRHGLLDQGTACLAQP